MGFTPHRGFESRPLRSRKAPQSWGFLLPILLPNQLVFSRRDGRVWQDHDWRNWRKRVFKPATKAAGLMHARPYDLRGSFASVLIQESENVVDVAKQLGHTPETCLRYVIERAARRLAARSITYGCGSQAAPLELPLSVRLTAQERSVWRPLPVTRAGIPGAALDRPRRPVADEQRALAGGY